MAEFVKVTDYTTLIKSKIIEEFKNTNVEEILTIALNPQAVEIEQVMADFLETIDLNTCTGESLDRIGEIINYPRDERLDDDYRKYLQLKAKSFTATGTINLILEAVLLLYDATEAHYYTNYPAGFIIQQNGSAVIGNEDFLVLDDDAYLLLDDDEYLIITLEDTNAVNLFNSLIPAGVSIDVQHI